MGTGRRTQRTAGALTCRALLMLGMLSLAVSGCRPDAPAVETGAEVAVPAARETPPEAAATCTPTRAEERLDALVLEDEAGTCRILLPLEPAAGTFPVRVSAAGTDDHAAAEWTVEGRLRFADRGEVVLESAQERLVGRAEVEASAGPSVLRMRAAFDLPAPAAP